MTEPRDKLEPMKQTQERPQTIREVMRVASGWLTEQGVEDAALDVQILLARALGCRRLDLFMDHDRPLEERELEAFRALMRRRAAREPVAYITGERGFFGLTFQVAPGVLIPRPESEHLVEVGLAELDRLEREAPRFADVGTGSGCVALALLSQHPSLRGVALDVSPEALSIARRNAGELGLTDRLLLARGDLLASLAPASLELVVSNPPYITPSEAHLLSPEVARYEPRQALFDAEGLPLTRRLVREARRVLCAGGALAIETGYQSADLVAGFMQAEGFEDVRRVPDLARIERVVVGRTPTP